MTLNALDAVIGVVYLTPKGRQLLRIDNAPDTPADSVRFRRLDEPRMGEEINVVGTYALSPAPVDAAPVVPSRVAKLLGAPIDTIVAAVEAREEPYKSSPLSDDDIEELMSLDSRDRVMRALRAEHARRIDAATVRAPLHTEAPAIVVNAQGPIDAEEVPLVVSAEPPPLGKGEWRDGVLVAALAESGALESIVTDAVAPFVGAPLTDATRDAVAEAVDAAVTRAESAGTDPYLAGLAAREEANEVAEGGVSEISTASASGSQGSDDGDTVATDPTDDLPWPAVAVESLGSEPAPAADPSTSSTPVDAQPVAVDVGGSEPTPTEPAKPEKVRPRGWCPACRQFLTVRADGTMMQHYTPDGAKGPDGKRIDCQGVGLTPAAERPPEPRLPLPVAMKVDPPVAPVVERPALVSPSSDPVIAEAVAAASEVLDAPVLAPDGDRPSRALESIREHDADAPPVAVRVPAPAPIRYVLGGSAPYGWAIIDLEGCAPMEREGGAVARWELREDAEAALVYVREHGELPDGTQPEEPAPVPLDSASTCDHTAGYVDGQCAACDADEPGEVGRLARHSARGWALADKLASENRELRNRPNATAIPQRPRSNPIDELSRIVEEAKTRGVRIRIVIEPIE